MGGVHLPPGSLLCFFTLANTLIYLDRGVIGVIATQATLEVLASKQEMDLSGTSAGALGSIFILGFMLSSPVFAYCAQSIAVPTLIGSGLLIWSLSTLCAGLATDYWMLLLARAVTGVGEAAIVCLVPPLVLDTAPSDKKTVLSRQLWVSVFYSAMVVGYALGFIFGQGTTELLGSWRAPFLIESALMLPFTLLSFCLCSNWGAQASPEPTSLKSQLQRLATNPVFCLIVAGYSSFAFTVGGMAFWGSTLIHCTYGVSPTVAALSMGTLTVLCGVVATFLGSVYMDFRLKSAQTMADVGEISEKRLRALRTEVACSISFTAIALGAVVGTLAALFRSYAYFLAGFSTAEFLLFLYLLSSSTGPLAMAVMSSVSADLRAQANAISVFLMHLLGDFPSPYLVGVASQWVGREWGLFMLVLWLFVGVVALGLAWLLAVSAM